MKNYLLLLLAFVLFGLSSCSKPDDNTNANPFNTVYYNSFENDSDLDPFEGYAALFSDEVPNNGGNQSLVVSGGCIAPHYYGEIGPFDQDYTVHLAIEGKSLEGLGGSISMHLPSNFEERIEIFVEDTSWKHYESGSLFIPAGEPVMIHFMSGGIAAATTFFDEIMLVAE